MNNPIIYYGPNFCLKCKNRSIEIFNYFNYPMGYDKIANAFMSGYPVGTLLDKSAIYKMRCRKCGTNYSIRWEGEYPVPDLYKSHRDNREFLQMFKALKK